jgi:hypothetical protein
MNKEPIPVVKLVPEWFALYGKVHCIFCGSETEYVYYPRVIPVCKDCGRKKNMHDLIQKISH